MSFKGYINYGDQQLILNNNFISGVQSVTTNTNFNLLPISIAGIGVLKTQINKQIVPSFSFEQVITNQDFVISLVSGNSCISGLFKHKDNILSFSSGYISNYSLSCQVGSVITSSTSLNCYGDYEYVENTGQFSNFSLNTSSLKIPDYSSVVIGLNDALIDRVISFSIDVNYQNVPVYGIGSINPKTYKLQYPIEVKASFTLEIDETKLQEISSNLCQKYEKDVTIFVNTRCQNDNVFSILMSGCSLSSQKYNGRIRNNASITVEYIKYFNKLPIFGSESEILLNPIGRFVMLEKDFPNRLLPTISTITKIGSYTITGNIN